MFMRDVSYIKLAEPRAVCHEYKTNFMVRTVIITLSVTHTHIHWQTYKTHTEKLIKSH